MDCVGCLWAKSDSGTWRCVRRDSLKLGEAALAFPETPNLGCDGKTRIAVNAAGSELVLVGAATFIPLPSGYDWES